jgi:hypothetical protein
VRKTALVLAVLMSTQALAEGMLHVPPWTMVNGKACYEFQDAKKLLVLDADLEAFIKKDAEWASLTQNLQESNRQLTLALTAEKRANVILKDNGEALTAELLATTARANKAEAKPGPFPAWAIAGGVGIAVGVIAGVVLGVYVAK